MENLNYIRMELSKTQSLINRVLANTELLNRIDQSVQLIVETLGNQGKVLLAGNGGSAADAQHFAGELVSRFNYDRPALAAIALTTDTSILTAVGNDYGYQHVFSRQIEAIGQSKDVLIAYTTSGKSPNILTALATASNQGMKTIVFTGQYTQELKALSTILIDVPSIETPKIQELHETIGHIICGLVETSIFPK